LCLQIEMVMFKLKIHLSEYVYRKNYPLNNLKMKVFYIIIFLFFSRTHKNIFYSNKSHVCLIFNPLNQVIVNDKFSYHFWFVIHCHFLNDNNQNYEALRGPGAGGQKNRKRPRMLKSQSILDTFFSVRTNLSQRKELFRRGGGETQN